MQGNFSYHNPTKLYFGDESLNYLKDELKNYGAWTHAPHGHCLAAVSMAYYRRAMKPGLAKFVRFAKNVWDVCPDGKTDEQIAEAGLAALKAWMQEIGLPLTISAIGATPDMIPCITEGTICYPAGYMDLKPEDITEILKESL